ncbi:MAG: tail fiber domain-containing protein [Bacteroidales bacterium]|nr:tail fiber domain-containing protein [Bacteroidales bacterium]
MKRIKTFFTFSLLLAALYGNAQIKIHDDNHISIGSLTKNYGVQVKPSGCTCFESRLNIDWTWITIAYTANSTAKCWIVSDYGTQNPHKFYVTGGGNVFMNGSVRQSDASLQSETQPISGASDIIDQINGVWYFPIVGEKSQTETRKIGVIAQEVEKILPEAVATDENELKYVDFEALTVLLIETVKEQRQEIQELRRVLEENDLIKK